MYKREIGRCCKVRANHTSDMIRKMGACRRKTLSRRIAVCVAMRNRCRTVELTRRRESKHPSPHRASCERRSRRSRPTIYSCSARPLVSPECCAAFGTFRKWVEAKVVKKHFSTSIAESYSVDIDIADQREGYDEKKY